MAADSECGCPADNEEALVMLVHRQTGEHTWHWQEQSPDREHLLLGAFSVAVVHNDGLIPKDNKFQAFSRLPGDNGVIGRFLSMEEAKAAAEDALCRWLVASGLRLVDLVEAAQRTKETGDD